MRVKQYDQTIVSFKLIHFYEIIIMAKYNIKDLEKLTGIKAHTIRIWEKRYDLIQPDRTETNFRLYNNDQLKRLLNISILNKAGVKIFKD